MSQIRQAIRALSPGDRVRLHQRLRARAARKRAQPLAYAQLWHRRRRSQEVADLLGSPHPTSQRDALGRLMRWSVSIAFLLGGNRSGKTESGAEWAIAQAMGRDHPAVQAWIRRNGWDPADVAIPEGPGVVWVGSVSFSDALEYLRPKLDKYLPEGCVRRNWGAEKQATVDLPGGGRIVSKAYAQGRKAWQGAGIRAAWLDEEPEDEGLVDETLMRLSDQGGRILFTMTPLLGLSWPYHRWIAPWEQGQAEDDQHVEEIHGVDNPWIDQGFLIRRLQAMDPATRAKRGMGRFQAARGLIYPMFSMDLHVADAPWDGPLPPPDWPRKRVIDFGATNPFCVLWFAKDPSTGTSWVYREHYQAEQSLAWHARRIREAETCPACDGLGMEEDGTDCPVCGGEGREYIPHSASLADPADRQARIDLARQHGIPTRPANKAVRAGILATQAALAPEPVPRLRFVRGATPNTLREIRGYQWRKATGTRDPDEPVKKDDHAMDCVRYWAMDEQLGTIGVG